MFDYARDWFERRRFRRGLWTPIAVGDDYIIRLPKGSTYEFSEKDQTLYAMLPTDPPTEFIAARWRFGQDDPADRAVAIRLLMDRFVTRHVAKAAGREIKKFQTWDRSEDGRTILHGLVPIDLDHARKRDTRWWLVQFEVAPDGEHFYFLHWNGPRRYFEPATRIFIAFEPRG
jgi:hypothetical protein